jgi:hypothetical protein
MFVSSPPPNPLVVSPIECEKLFNSHVRDGHESNQLMRQIESARETSTLDRRDALGRISLGLAGGAAGAAGTSAAELGPAPRLVRGRLKLGCQKRPTTAAGVHIWQRFGVTRLRRARAQESPARLLECRGIVAGRRLV